MRRALLLASGLAALAAGPALSQAETARLRAYDVAGASRVELPLPAGGFSLERSGARQVDLLAEGAAGLVDLSEAAAGGLARRVLSARLVEDERGLRLRFLLACDCDFAARVADGVLAIEFREPGATAPEVAEAETAEEAPRARIAGNEGRRAPRFAFAPPPRGAGAPVSGVAVTGEGGAAPSAAPTPAEEEILIARQRLLEQLSRAAEQGLLEFASPEAAAAVPPPPQDAPRGAPAAPPAEEPAPVVAMAEPEPEPEPDYASEPEPAPAPGPVELPVRARTAQDKAFRADRAETLVETARCIDDRRFSAGSWPDADDFAAEQARLSSALLDEFDNPVPDMATDLARLYIAAGFGAEARRLIEFYGEAIEDAALLVDLSLVVEGSRPRADGPLRAAGPCSGPAALWYRAAGLQPPPSGAGAAEREAQIAEEMVAAFARLPVPLRVLLGPPLVSDLVARNEVETARRIDLLLRRIPGDHGPAFDLARARLLAASGDGASQAEALLARLGGRDLPESREALLLLLDSLIARGAPVPPDLAEALAEAAFIARGGPMERRLKIAEIRARARAEGPPAALEAVRAALARTPGARMILHDAGHAVLEEASAAEVGPLAYVRAVLAYRDEISEEPAGDAARRRVAEELTGAGLANAALAILEPALRRGGPGARRAAASARLALGDAEGALAALEGLADPDAERMRAAADDLAGRPEAALGRLDALGGAEPEARAALALRAGAWAEASIAGTPERRLLAAWMAGPEGAPELTAGEAAPEGATAFLDPPRMGGEVKLGDAQSVMDASRAVRAVIEEALGDG